jgi:hypothetical protein
MTSSRRSTPSLLNLAAPSGDAGEVDRNLAKQLAMFAGDGNVSSTPPANDTLSE